MSEAVWFKFAWPELNTSQFYILTGIANNLSQLEIIHF